MGYLIINDFKLNINAMLLYSICSIAIIVLKLSKLSIFIQFIIMCFMISHVLTKSMYCDTTNGTLVYYSTFFRKRYFIVVEKVIYLMLVFLYVYIFEILIYIISQNETIFMLANNILPIVFLSNCVYLFFAFVFNVFHAKDYLYFLGSIFSLVILLVFNNFFELDMVLGIINFDIIKMMIALILLFSIGTITLTILLFEKKDF